MDAIERFRLRRRTRLTGRYYRADSFDDKARIAFSISRMDDDTTTGDKHWITTETGSHLLVNGEDEVVAGAGGALNGEKLEKAKSESPKKPAKEKSSKPKKTAAKSKAARANENVGNAYKSGAYLDVYSAFRAELSNMSPGETVSVTKQSGDKTTYTKTGDGMFEYKYERTQETLKATLNALCNSQDCFNKEHAPKFEETKTSESPKKSNPPDASTEPSTAKISFNATKLSTDKIREDFANRLSDAAMDGDEASARKVLEELPVGACIIGSDKYSKNSDGTFTEVNTFWLATRQTMTANQVVARDCYVTEDGLVDVRGISSNGIAPQNSNPDADEHTGYGLFEKKTEGSKINAVQRLSDKEKRDFFEAAITYSVIDPDYLNSASQTQYLSAALNSNAKPETITTDEFESARANGELVLYRSVATQEAVDSLMYGDETYLGDGVAGDGIYASDSRKNNYETNTYGDKKIGICFNEKAVIKEDSEVQKEMYNSNCPMEMSISDYALMKGYDGYWFNNGGDERYYVLLKRDNMRVCQLGG